jgi:hypothetical protein
MLARLVTLVLVLSASSAWAVTFDEVSLAYVRSTQGGTFYTGAVTGTLWTLINTGLMQCPLLTTGGVVQQALESVLVNQPERGKTPFTSAVAGAMLNLGCAWTTPTPEAKAYY